jgi:hypothetical protein
MDDVRVEAHYVDANGTTRQFTPSTGTDDFAVVDEALANSDTDYLSSSSPGDVVTMGLQNLIATGSTILGLQVVAQVRKETSGSAGHEPAFRIGGVNYFGTEVLISSTYEFTHQCYGKSPASGIAWTESEFNNAEVGAKKST